MKLEKGFDRDRAVYDDFSSMLGKQTLGKTRILEDNLSFPNRIRTTDWEMEVYLRMVNYEEPVRLNSIFSKKCEGQLELHIVQQRVEISRNPQKFSSEGNPASRSNEKETNVLERMTSWKLTEEQLDCYIRAYNAPALIAIEYRKRPANPDYNPKFRIHKKQLENTLYDPTQDDYRHRKSFLRRPLTEEEIRDKLVFIDAEFTGDLIDKTQGLVSIAILNIEGEKLINEFTTPRQKMIRTGQRHHGITERMMRGQKDEYEVIEKVQQLCFGKILVGHDLQAELKILNINKKGLLGIRDLSAARTLHEMGHEPKAGGQLFKLKELAKDIIKREIQLPGRHSAFEDAKAIRDIYNVIGFKYIDHKIWEATEVNINKRKTIPDCRVIIEKRRKENMDEDLEILDVNLDSLIDPGVELMDEEDILAVLEKESPPQEIGKNSKLVLNDAVVQTIVPVMVDQATQADQDVLQKQIEALGRTYYIESVIYKTLTGEKLTFEGL